MLSAMSPTTMQINELFEASPAGGWAASFQRNGFVAVPGLFSHAEIAEWKAIVLDTRTPTADRGGVQCLEWSRLAGGVPACDGSSRTGRHSA